MHLGAPEDGSVISKSVQACFAGFKETLTGLSKAEDTIKDKLSPWNINDEIGRFRLWCANVAAHRVGKSSLDYKLREASHIKIRVLELLKNLQIVIHEANEIIRGERVSWEDLSDSESDTSDADLPPVGGDDSTELQQLASNIAEIITCLMRLSIAIRNPAPHDQFKESTQIDTSHFEAFDIDHVRGKFPHAEEWLVTRLGKAISRRRQYLRYRDEHRKKLEKGLELPEITAVPIAEVTARPETVISSQKIESTVASSIPIAMKVASPATQIDQHDYYEDTLSQTSYASSVDDAIKLRPPPIPELGQDGDPFECPLCYRFTSVRQVSAWHKHVYRDLQPYICSFEACEIADRTYDSRHAWFAHEHESHRQWYSCICNRSFKSRKEFTRHLQQSHADVDEDRLEDLISSCQRRSDMEVAAECPLCRVQLSSLTQLRRHLGKHHEELSLFALPSHMKDDKDEDGDGDDDRDESDARSLGSSLSNRSMVNHEVAICVFCKKELHGEARLEDLETHIRTEHPEFPMPGDPTIFNKLASITRTKDLILDRQFFLTFKDLLSNIQEPLSGLWHDQSGWTEHVHNSICADITDRFLENYRHPARIDSLLRVVFLFINTELQRSDMIASYGEPAPVWHYFARVVRLVQLVLRERQWVEAYADIERHLFDLEQNLIQTLNMPQQHSSFITTSSPEDSINVKEVQVTSNRTYSILVSNISPEFRESDLMELFQRRYPSCLAARIPRDENGVPGKVGLVHFMTEREQLRAISEMDGFSPGHSKIRVIPGTEYMTLPISRFLHIQAGDTISWASNRDIEMLDGTVRNLADVIRVPKGTAIFMVLQDSVEAAAIQARLFRDSLTNLKDAGFEVLALVFANHLRVKTWYHAQSFPFDVICHSASSLSLEELFGAPPLHAGLAEGGVVIIDKSWHIRAAELGSLQHTLDVVKGKTDQIPDDAANFPLVIESDQPPPSPGQLIPDPSSTVTYSICTQRIPGIGPYEESMLLELSPWGMSLKTTDGVELDKKPWTAIRRFPSFDIDGKTMSLGPDALQIETFQVKDHLNAARIFQYCFEKVREAKGSSGHQAEDPSPPDVQMQTPFSDRNETSATVQFDLRPANITVASEEPWAITDFGSSTIQEDQNTDVDDNAAIGSRDSMQFDVFVEGLMRGSVNMNLVIDADCLEFRQHNNKELSPTHVWMAYLYETEDIQLHGHPSPLMDIHGRFLAIPSTSKEKIAERSEIATSKLLVRFRHRPAAATVMWFLRTRTIWRPPIEDALRVQEEDSPQFDSECKNEALAAPSLEPQLSSFVSPDIPIGYPFYGVQLSTTTKLNTRSDLILHILDHHLLFRRKTALETFKMAWQCAILPNTTALDHERVFVTGSLYEYDENNGKFVLKGEDISCNLLAESNEEALEISRNISTIALAHQAVRTDSQSSDDRPALPNSLKPGTDSAHVLHSEPRPLKSNPLEGTAIPVPKPPLPDSFDHGNLVSVVSNLPFSSRHSNLQHVLPQVSTLFFQSLPSSQEPADKSLLISALSVDLSDHPKPWDGISKLMIWYGNLHIWIPDQATYLQAEHHARLEMTVQDVETARIIEAEVSGRNFFKWEYHWSEKWKRYPDLRPLAVPSNKQPREEESLPILGTPKTIAALPIDIPGGQETYHVTVKGLKPDQLTNVKLHFTKAHTLEFTAFPPLERRMILFPTHEPVLHVSDESYYIITSGNLYASALGAPTWRRERSDAQVEIFFASAVKANVMFEAMNSTWSPFAGNTIDLDGTPHVAHGSEYLTIEESKHKNNEQSKDYHVKVSYSPIRPEPMNSSLYFDGMRTLVCITDSQPPVWFRTDVPNQLSMTISESGGFVVEAICNGEYSDDTKHWQTFKDCTVEIVFKIGYEAKEIYDRLLDGMKSSNTQDQAITPPLQPATEDLLPQAAASLLPHSDHTEVLEQISDPISYYIYNVRVSNLIAAHTGPQILSFTLVPDDLWCLRFASPPPSTREYQMRVQYSDAAHSNYRTYVAANRIIQTEGIVRWREADNHAWVRESEETRVVLIEFEYGPDGEREGWKDSIELTRYLTENHGAPRELLRQIYPDDDEHSETPPLIPGGVQDSRDVKRVTPDASVPQANYKSLETGRGKPYNVRVSGLDPKVVDFNLSTMLTQSKKDSYVDWALYFDPQVSSPGAKQYLVHPVNFVHSANLVNGDDLRTVFVMGNVFWDDANPTKLMEWKSIDDGGRGKQGLARMVFEVEEQALEVIEWLEQAVRSIRRV